MQGNLKVDFQGLPVPGGNSACPEPTDDWLPAVKEVVGAPIADTAGETPGG